MIKCTSAKCIRIRRKQLLLAHADFLKLSIGAPDARQPHDGKPTSLEDQSDEAQTQRISSIEILSRALQDSGDVRVQALRVLAVAAANNVPFQKALLQQQEQLVPWLLEVR